MSKLASQEKIQLFSVLFPQCKMNVMKILLVLYLASTGICGQKIELRYPSQSEACENGFRANIDYHYFIASIGPQFSELINYGWILVLKFTVLPVGATNFITLCETSIHPSGSSCVSKSPNPCYCFQFDSTTSTAKIFMKYDAQVLHSLGTVRGQLDNNNGSVMYSTTNKTLPGIYDVKAAELTLHVNGNPANKTSESCGARFNPNANNTIKLCCSKAPMPCYPTLAFNGKVVTQSYMSPCAEYIFAAKKETVNVTKTYTVCNSTEPMPRGFCVIEARLPSTTVKPTTSTAAAGLLSTTVKPTTSTAAAANKSKASKSTSASTVTESTLEPTSSSTVTEPEDKDTMLPHVLSLAIPIALSVSVITFYFVKYFLDMSADGEANPETN